MSNLAIVVRNLCKHWGASTASILTLGLAISANTVAFSVLERVLHPLNARSPDQVVLIEGDFPGLDLHHSPLAPAELFDIAAQGGSLFASVAGFRIESATFVAPRVDPIRITVGSTVGPFFALLGVRPLIGTLFRGQQLSPLAKGGAVIPETPSVVMSYHFWLQATGGDQAIIGKTVLVDDEVLTVLGVAPEDFNFPLNVSLWTNHPIPRALGDREERGRRLVNVLARLEPSTSLAYAAAGLGKLQLEWKRRFPVTYAQQQSLVASPIEESMSASLRPVVFLILGASLFVLLVACLNVAMLVLIQLSAREQEMAIRLALGAQKSTVAIRYAAEGVLISVVGGGLGAGIAAFVIPEVGRVVQASAPLLQGIRLDWRVLGFAVLVSAGATVLSTIVPIFTGMGVGVRGASELLSPRGGSTGHRQSVLLRTTVVLQVAFAFVLLASADVVFQSVRRLVMVNPGFNAQGVVTMRLTLPQSRYPDDLQRESFANRLLRQLSLAPPVQVAGLVSGGPFGYLKEGEHTTIVRSANKADVVEGKHSNIWLVQGDYFRAMGIPVLAGRVFTDQDTRESPRVAIVDELLARALFPGTNAVAKTLQGGVVIVGVVGAVKKTDLAAAANASIYYPFSQSPSALTDMTIVVRGSNIMQSEGSLRSVVRELDPQLALSDLETIGSGIARSLATRKLVSWVLGFFGAVASVLALVGIYGVISFVTSQRRRELGIRVAIGATRLGIMKMMLLEGGGLVAGGLLCGWMVYLACSRWLSSIVFDISTGDVATLVVCGAVLAISALLAISMPVWRGASQDPASVLRS